MSEYNEYCYLWPPRPEKSVPAPLLGFYEKQGFVAQYKKNGTCTEVYVAPDRSIITKTRHDTDHKAWKDQESKAVEWFKNLPGDKWYVFECELLHNKTPLVKDTLYVFDILVADGELLTGTTFAERQELLKNLFGITDNMVPAYSHYVINDNLWLAKQIDSGFKETMKFVQNRADQTDGAPTDEGLVMKRPDAKLEAPTRQKANSGWQVKCRVSTKNYTF